jgi:hypothetical protein
MQFTISLYVVGLAVGQLVHGPLADRFGYRRILMIGLSVHTAASIGAGMARSVEELVAMRLIQSLGGGFGLVLVRAIARIGADTSEATRRLALIGGMAMYHDRTGTDELPLTHENMSLMLGVRRASITQAVRNLEAESLIRARRGLITIRDRSGLEGYCGGFYGVAEARYAEIMGGLPDEGFGPRNEPGASSKQELRPSHVEGEGQGTV